MGLGKLIGKLPIIGTAAAGGYALGAVSDDITEIVPSAKDTADVLKMIGVILLLIVLSLAFSSFVKVMM